MESPTPGFVAQAKCMLTIQRYQVATIFVDQHSLLGYVHLQGSTTSKEMVEAKKAFERFAASQGVKVKHYHTDNGHFADNAWMHNLEKQKQTISFSAFGAHFQNGVAEKRIRNLQDSAQTMLLEARGIWPDAVSEILWPYAVCLANDVLNATPRLDNTDLSPIEIFTCSQIRPKLDNFHTFGCPVYTVMERFQNG